MQSKIRSGKIVMAYSFESISYILGYSVVKVQNFKSIEAKEIKSPSISKGQ
jgi:hypothetical protein